MQTLKFSIHINATAEKVWNCLWESENYQHGTGVFCVGSYYQTEQFAEGHKIQLLSPTGDGKYGMLEKVDPCTLLIFRHIGEIKNFLEQFVEQNSTPSSIASESLQLCAGPKGNELVVQIDTPPAKVLHMGSIFPASLQVLSRIVEPNGEDSYLCATAEVLPLPYRCTFLKNAPN
jgi:hypothetical protein